MTLKTTQLRDAIVFALCVGATSLAGTGLASAQDASAPAAAPAEADATTLDRIQVTGSRISIPGLTTNSPVMTVDREEIDRNQPVTAEDFLKILPGATPAIGPGVNNGANGGATVNLRGLGDNRTLVLMDGRRVVPFNLFGVVDTNVIPVALIESVDLVTGGASAVYGADAVSGVVNFVLKRNFEGVEVNTSYGQSSKQDGDRRRTDVTLGVNLDDGRGNVVVSVGKSDNDPLLQGARSFSEFNIDSTDGSQGGSGTSIPTKAGSLGQINPATGSFDGIQTLFNFNPYNFNQTALDRWQATALGRYEINDHAEAYTQLLYTRSNVFSQIAPGGLFGGRFNLGIGNPLIPEPARQQLCAAFGVTGGPCSVGSAGVVSTTLNRRTTELGTRSTDFQNKVFQATLGVRGNITDNWRYDAYWSHGEADQLVVSAGFLSKARTQQALLSTDGINCVDPTGGCVPLNLWGVEGSISQDAKKFLEVLTFATQRVEQEVWSGSVNGDLGDSFKSPWAEYPIGLAFGLEGRKVDAMNQADAASRDPVEVQGSGGANPDVRGNLSLKEAYVEVIAPLISGKPGAYALNFEGGYRHTEFKSGQTDVDYGSYKYGLEWAPIESLRFRGMFQRATRAPNINELFQPVFTQLDNSVVDPCQEDLINAAEAGTPGTLSNLCVLTGVPLGSVGSVEEPSAGQANIFAGGNPVLGPEKADTQTLGLVWQPTDEFSLTLDYWKIDIKDAITRPVIDDVFFGCYDRSLNPTLSVNHPFCQLMLGGRDTGDGSVNGEARGPFLDRSNNGRITTDGWDLGVRYGIPLSDNWGRLDFSLDLTKTDSYKYKGHPLAIERECVGLYGISCNTIAGIIYDYKSSFRAVWSIKDFELGVNWRHLSSIDVEEGKVTFAPQFTSIDAYDYFDLTMAYDLPWNARINLTVNNIADKKPPMVGSNIGNTAFNSGNTFPQYYDTLGRYYTLGLTMRF
ncbi:TonB-dependent receptor domain-containing protein [Lysobacter capsici]|uniref:TonB-dependent receptor domain-containing protein n=1 Tax=Lysobacter capsici TaxID=435897 RepID=UPI00062775BA|nr:TonB-dependent receptor [Lysobacter capsici]